MYYLYAFVFACVDVVFFSSLALNQHAVVYLKMMLVWQEERNIEGRGEQEEERYYGWLMAKNNHDTPILYVVSLWKKKKS